MRRLFSLFLVIALLAGCSKSEPDNPIPEKPKQESVTLSSGTNAAPVIATAGGSTNVSFTASSSWSASIINTKADSWCSVSPTSGGAGAATITITVKENTTPDNRSASVVIKAGTATQTIKVEQKQQDALTVTASSFEVPAEGGEIKVTAKSNVSFTHTISTDAQKWIKAVETKALKDSTLIFEILTNDGVANRSGQIFLASGNLKDTVNVYQAGVTPTIVVSKDEYVLKSEGESFEVEVASNVNATMNMVYPQGVEAWIEENTSKSISTNKFYFTAKANDGYDSRSAMIVFSNVENNLADTVTVSQAQKDAIVVAKSEYEFDKEGGNLDFEIQTNVDVTVTIPDSCSSWIRQVETRGLEAKKLFFDILPSDSVAREGKIILTGGSVTQTISIVQRCPIEINPIQMPDNEIWYITLDGSIVNVLNNSFDQSILSNTYSNNKGVIKLSGELHTIKSMAFSNLPNLKFLALPNSVETLEDNAFYFVELDSLYISSNLKNFTGNSFSFCKIGRFTGSTTVKDNGRFIVIDDTLKAVATIQETELTIPGSIKVIGNHALGIDNSNIKKVIIEEGVEEIWHYAFYNSRNIEYVYLPESLKNLSYSVFDYCDNIRQFYGPSKFVSSDGKVTYRYVPFIGREDLKYISNVAKAGLTDYVVDTDIRGIDPESFCRAYDLKSLTINSTNIYISGDTFDECYNLESIIGPGATSDGRGYVGSGSALEECTLENAKLLVFAGKGISEYSVGNYCSEIGSNVFAYQKDLKTIKFDDEIIRLGAGVFWGSQQLEEVTLPANLKHIGIHTFWYCPNLKNVYLRSPIPPTLERYGTTEDDIFQIEEGLDGLKIYVPETAVSLYKNTFPWNRYSNYILGYKPDYDYYISTDYSQDGKVVTLQTATKGNGIDIVLMGDAYSDRQIADGTYKADMLNLYNNLFTEEPYKSFKDHFNVYYVNVVSTAEGYDHGGAALDGYFGDGTLAGGNDNKVFEYALKAISENKMDDALLVVAMNSDNYAGTCYMYYPVNSLDYGSGVSVSYFPKGGDAETFAQLIHHEACGHGFAKLADEYAYEDMGAVSSDYVAQTKSQQNNWGWWKNVDFTNDPAQVRWAKFLEDSRYANDGLGVFEGGLTYCTGVWRPTENSIMRYDTGGFNAPSREAIYYRIHKLAYGTEWVYDYEKFVEYDAVNHNASTAVSTKSPSVVHYKPLHQPVVYNKSWRDAKKEN